jgi:hypothetical protein
MRLEKDGITVEHEHPADIARLKALGYKVVEKPLKAEALPPAPPVAEKTPEQLNAEAVDAVNNPKITKGGAK